MLIQTDAPEVLVFEPSPEALFYLTRSLRLAAAESGDRWRVAERAKVYRVAAGSASAMSRIYVEQHNLGNAAIGKPVLDAETLYIRDVYDVKVMAVDDVLRARMDDGFSVRLLKMDVQGSECAALTGMAQMLARGTIKALHTEVSERFLRRHECSANELLHRLKRNGYQLDPYDATVAMGFDVTARLPTT